MHHLHPRCHSDVVVVVVVVSMIVVVVAAAAAAAAAAGGSSSGDSNGSGSSSSNGCAGSTRRVKACGLLSRNNDMYRKLDRHPCTCTRAKTMCFKLHIGGRTCDSQDRSSQTHRKMEPASLEELHRHAANWQRAVRIF